MLTRTNTCLYSLSVHTQLQTQISLTFLISSWLLCVLPERSLADGIAGLNSAGHASKQQEEDYLTAKPRCLNCPSFSSPHFPSPHPVSLHFPQHLPSTQTQSTWDEPQSLRDEHTANNLWCLSKEVRSFLHTLGTFFLPPLFCSTAKRTFWYVISGWRNGRQTDTCAQCTFVFLLLTYDRL